MAASNSANPKWRAATVADLITVQRLVDYHHPGLPERPEVFAEKLELFHDECLVLVQEGAIVDYCLSHAWLPRNIPPLDALLGCLPPSP